MRLEYLTVGLSGRGVALGCLELRWVTLGYVGQRGVTLHGRGLRFTVRARRAFT